MKLRLVLFAALALFAGGCKEKPQEGLACESNLDCTSPGTRCDVPSGRCVCATDEACTEPDTFCNQAGVCQALAGCVSNIDCEKMPNSYCDISTGRCLQGPSLMLSSACGLSSHCPFGTTCRDGTCVPHCYDDGDCPLGQVCLQEQCVSGPNICSSDDFCGYGQICSDSTFPGTCRDDNKGPYCRGCRFRQVPQNPEPCDHPRNFCLINNFETGGFASFCGVDCSITRECPNGYACNNVIILTDDVCFTNAQCRCDPDTISYAQNTCSVPANCDPRLPNGEPDPDAPGCLYNDHPSCNGAPCYVARGQRDGDCYCGSDSDCPNGGRCIDRLCCGTVEREDRDCAAGENRVSGFCTCATDDDCPRDVCDGSRRACAISGHPCEPGQDNCGPIPCINGGCQIGANCAPLQGLSCSIVTAE